MSSQFEIKLCLTLCCACSRHMTRIMSLERRMKF